MLFVQEIPPLVSCQPSIYNEKNEFYFLCKLGSIYAVRRGQ